MTGYDAREILTEVSEQFADLDDVEFDEELEDPEPDAA